MGRAPCCDKANVKRGPWSPEEDEKLRTYIEEHGTGGNWIALPQKIGLKRCGKSCRLRWLNYLRPNLKHGGFSEEEDTIICSLYVSIGSRWSIIAAQLPGRTDNDIKNYWNTRLKKKLLGKQRNYRKGGYSAKQGTRKSPDKNSMASSISINQTFPSWSETIPDLAPIPYSNHEPQFNDHASFKKLFFKLGGKFSDDENYIQTGPNTQLPVISSYEVSNSIDAITSCSSIDASNVYTSQCSGLPMLPVDISVLGEFERIQYDHNIPHSLDGLEFLYDATTGNSFNWGEHSNLGYRPSTNAGFESTLQQGYGFGEMSSARGHQEMSFTSFMGVKFSC